ncbi:MAG: tyrosine-type recombinase/integrase [Acidobacteria bacterium]|nr:tyrosine-type recombinase/integrase [Acidobacteriota bacterium]
MGDFLVCALSSIRSYKHNVINYWLYADVANRRAGIETKIGCHTFRATGITIYLTNGGDLEKAQQMAAHESPRTTKLYDRRNEVVSLDEVEKVVC